MRITTLAAMFVCLVGVAPARAQLFERSQSETIITSDAALPSVTYRAGTSTIEMRAERGVNIEDLLIAAKIRPTDDGQSIVDKVNKVRERLYPDREISIVVSVPRQSGARAGIRVWRYYLSWNRRSRLYYWWTTMQAAVTFMDDVLGTWNYYECFGCRSWAYRYRIGTGGALTRALTGYTTMGFDYRPQTAGARADIVMWFFN